MIKDSALDRLFPESMRYHKGHVADPDHKGGGWRPLSTRTVDSQAETCGHRQKGTGSHAEDRTRQYSLPPTHEGRSRLHQSKRQTRNRRPGRLHPRLQGTSASCRPSMGTSIANPPKRSPQTIVVPTAAGSSSPCRPVRRQRVSKQHAANGLKTR